MLLYTFNPKTYIQLLDSVEQEIYIANDDIFVVINGQARLDTKVYTMIVSPSIGPQLSVVAR